MICVSVSLCSKPISSGGLGHSDKTTISATSIHPSTSHNLPNLNGSMGCYNQE